jgi:hypothetical protein
MTRGVHPSRRWHGDGGRAAAKGEALPTAGSRAEELCTGGRGGRAEQGSTCPRKKKRGEGSEGLVWKS